MLIKLNNDTELLLDNQKGTAPLMAIVRDSSDGSLHNAWELDEGLLYEYLTSQCESSPETNAEAEIRLEKIRAQQK